MNNIWTNNNKSAATIPAAILPAINAMDRVLSGEGVNINELPAMKGDFTEAIENGTASCGTAGQNFAPWTKEARMNLKKAVARFLLERDKDDKTDSNPNA
jgi:hypothetical protein